MIRVLKVQKGYRVLKHVTVHWFSASFFPYYVPACTENIQIKLNLLLVTIQELTIGSRGFLCELRFVQVPKKLFAYYATRTIIIIFMETITISLPKPVTSSSPFLIYAVQYERNK
jgi:hypothetical protein